MTGADDAVALIWESAAVLGIAIFVVLIIFVIGVLRDRQERLGRTNAPTEP